MSSRDRYIDPATGDYAGTLSPGSVWDDGPEAIWFDPVDGLATWDAGASRWDLPSVWDNGDTIWDVQPAGPLRTTTAETRIYLALGTTKGSFALDPDLGNRIASRRFKMAGLSTSIVRDEVLLALKRDIDAGRLRSVTVSDIVIGRNRVDYTVSCTDGLTGEAVVLPLSQPL